MNKAKVFGRIVGLSTVLATLIVIVFLGLATMRPVVHARAQDENTTTGCTLATVAGNYGGLGSGTGAGVTRFTSVGIYELNGEGKVVENWTANLNGKIGSATITGTYTLNSNCPER
jgi:hypothetical protein